MSAAVIQMPSTNAPLSNELPIRERIRAMLEGDKKLSQARLAREAGIGSSTVSQYLADVYGGDNAAVEQKLLLWIEQAEAKREVQERMPVAPEYVETPTSERVIGALRYAHVAGDIAVAYGGAGVGKTSAIRHYAKIAPNVWIATMSPATASVVTALEEIADAVGASTSSGGGAAKLHRAINRRVTGSGGLIVIDETQHLGVAAMDQIRSINDATGVGITFVGNEAVYTRMTGGNRAAHLDRLYSRVGKKVAVRKSTADDVDAILDAWQIEDRTCRGVLLDIASKPGAIRGLTKVLRLATVHSYTQKRALCCDDVRSAWRELGAAE